MYLPFDQNNNNNRKNFWKSELLEEALNSINFFIANLKDSDECFISHIGPDTGMLKEF